MKEHQDLMQHLEDARAQDAKVLAIWSAAQSEKVERYSAEKGRVVTIPAPEYANPKEIRESIRQDILDGVPVIHLPAAVVTKSGLKIEAFKTIGNIVDKIVDYPFLVEALDPVFSVPEGVKIYRNHGTTGKYWALSGSSLVECIDESGHAVRFTSSTEGYKAKQARLQREEEERQRQAELERMQREEEAEQARQESQLGILKALPTDKFNKLMKLLNG